MGMRGRVGGRRQGWKKDVPRSRGDPRLGITGRPLPQNPPNRHRRRLCLPLPPLLHSIAAHPGALTIYVNHEMDQMASHVYPLNHRRHTRADRTRLQSDSGRVLLHRKRARQGASDSPVCDGTRMGRVSLVPSPRGVVRCCWHGAME